MVEQGANIVNKEGVQRFGDFFLVGEVKSPIERYPVLDQRKYT